MPALLETPDLAPVQGAIAAALARVTDRFDRQLRSDLPAVSRLVRHVESYRGKMLRPTLVLACGLAARDPAPRTQDPGPLSDSHITLAAVVEMIHMATLVHDDVLDEADTRRRGQTVNALHGNESAVILGDYLIASAYHLCSQLDSQRIALLVAHTAMTLCSGELLQLSRRCDFSLDERTYLELIRRKTASLVALSCRLGAEASGAEEAMLRRFERFGEKVGMAFQIQDDLLDLTGRKATLGKPVGQDLAKGKLTLPLIHHLATVPPTDRGRALRLLEQATATGGTGVPPASTITDHPTRPAYDGTAWTPTPRDAAAALVRAVEASGSLAHARRIAETLVAEAKAELASLPNSPPKRLLLTMADAVVGRDR
jgi:octaprenyl-diphosphate synthase